MLRFSVRQRAVLGETLRELANFAAAALVFGQFVGQQLLSWRIFIAGVAVWLVLISYALFLEGDQQWRMRCGCCGALLWLPVFSCSSTGWGVAKIASRAIAPRKAPRRHAAARPISPCGASKLSPRRRTGLFKPDAISDCSSNP